MAKRHNRDSDATDEAGEGSTVLFNRRGFLAASGAAFAAGATSIMGTASATQIDLGAEGLSPGDRIDGYLDDHFNSGNEVHIPAGTYQWDGGGLHGNYDDAQLIGDGDVVFDTGGGRVNLNIRGVGGRTVIRNVTLEGKDRSGDSRIAVWADGGAEVILDNFNRPDGSVDGQSIGFYVPPEHAGRLVFRECTVSYFGNNGIYASAPGKPSGGRNGQVVVEGGLFKNNNVASIRVGGNDAVVRGATVVHDGRITRIGNGTSNGRGIWVREEGDDITIEDCDLYFGADSDGATFPLGIQPHTDGGSGVVRNCRIHCSTGSDPIVMDSAGRAGNWSGGGVHLTGGDTSVSSPMDGWIECAGDSCDVPTTDEGKADGGSSDDGGDDTNDTDGGDVAGRRVEVLAASGGPLFTYGFVATGAVAPVTDAGSSSAEGNDSIGETADGNTEVTGAVGNGFGDTFQVEGDLLSFEADTDPANYTLRVDGEDVDPSSVGDEADDEPAAQAEVVVQAAEGGPAFDYTLLVTGSVTKVTDAGSTSAEGNDAIDESDDGTTTVTGRTGNGFGDAYLLEGSLDGFETDTDPANYALLVDGQEVDPATLGGSDGSDETPLPNRISFEAAEGQTGSYAFEVSGEVRADPDAGDVEDTDAVSGSAVEGEVSGEVDAYRFSGDVVGLELAGAATVSIEDNE